MPATDGFPTVYVPKGEYENPYERLAGQDNRPVPLPTNEDLARLGLPLASIEMSWDDYKDRATTDKGESLRNVFLEVAETLEERLTEFSYNGLVVLGQAGVGKSLGAALLLKDALTLMRAQRRHRPKEAPRRVTGCFLSAAGFLKESRRLIQLSKEGDPGARSHTDGSFGKTRRDWERNLEVVRTVDVLVLDDLGKERSPQGSNFAETEMENHVLRSRGSMGLLTIVTSNLAGPQFQRYSPSMWSYLHEVGEVVGVATTSPDFRKRQPRRPTV